MKKQLTALAVSGMLTMSAAFAGTINPSTDVTSFSAGTAAKAAEVNANFQALITAINDNASRIAALESATPDNSVAGNTYRIFSLNTEVAAGDSINDTDGLNDFSNISTGSLDGTITFDTINLTGTLTLNQDEYYEVNIPGHALTDFSENPVPVQDTFTFQQTGSEVALTFNSDGSTVTLVVSPDGSTVMARTAEKPAATTFNDGSPGTTAFTELVIGIKQ